MLRNLTVVSFGIIMIAGCASTPIPGNEYKKEFVYDGTAPFVNEQSIKKEVRNECNLNDNLANAIIQKSNEHGLVLSSNSTSERKFSVEIATATPGVFVFGNLGSVPAVLNVSFKVTEGDKTILVKRRQCSTNLAGFMGLQPSACNKLNKCAENQAEFIARSLEKL